MNAANKINARFGCIIIMLAVTCQTEIFTLPPIDHQTLADATSMTYQYAADNPGKVLAAGIFGTAWLIYRTGRCRGFSGGYPEGVGRAKASYERSSSSLKAKPESTSSATDSSSSPKVKQDQSTFLKIGTLGMWYIYHLGQHRGYDYGKTCGHDDWLVSTKCSKTSLRHNIGTPCCAFHSRQQWCKEKHEKVPKNSSMGYHESGKSTWPGNPFMALYHFCWKR
ncbi:hypothetical protein KJZ61_02120 [Candidatus Dependentiae bacterium]|nr:hypothetical protein [Candidatus Dependentiae bacterium]